MIITKENIMYNSMYDPENDTCDNISRRSETAQVLTDQGSNKRDTLFLFGNMMMRVNL